MRKHSNENFKKVQPAEFTETKGGEQEEPMSPEVEKVRDEYNESFDNDEKRESFFKSHSPIRFSASNAIERTKDPKTSPIFETADDGNYYAIPENKADTEVNVVPRFDLSLQESSFGPGAMREAFDCYPDVDPEMTYDGAKIIRPAVFTRDISKGTLELKEKGEIYLGGSQNGDRVTVSKFSETEIKRLKTERKEAEQSEEKEKSPMHKLYEKSKNVKNKQVENLPGGGKEQEQSVEPNEVSGTEEQSQELKKEEVREIEVEKEEDIEGEPFPFNFESKGFEELTKKLKFDLDLKIDARAKMGNEIKDKEAGINEILKEFYLKWFEDNKESEVIENMGISVNLKLNDDTKIAMAIEVDAFEELTEGEYDEFSEKIQDIKEEIQHIHNVDSYLKNTNNIPFEIRFEVLNILNRRTEKMEGELEDIENDDERTKKQNQIKELLGTREKLAESIKGEPLDDETAETIKQEMENQQGNIENLSRSDVATELGEREDYSGFDKIKNEDLVEVFKKDWELYAKIKNLDVSDLDQRKIYIDEHFNEELTNFKDFLGDNKYNEYALVGILKEGYTSKDLKKVKKYWLFGEDVGFRDKKTKKSYLNSEDFVAKKANSYEGEFNERQNVLEEEWNNKFDEAVLKHTEIVKGEVSEGAMNTVIEKVARSPLETGKTQEDINKRLKDLMWTLKVEKEILKGDENKPTKQHIAEFKKAGVKNSAGVISDAWLGRGSFENVPSHPEEAQEWFEESFSDTFPKKTKFENIFKGKKGEAQKKKWAEGSKNKRTLFSLFFEIISEFLDDGKKIKTNTKGTTK